MKRFIAAIALAAGLTMGSNAMAADWNFYGSARIEAFWSDVEDSTGNSETNYSETLQTDSRIGAKVKVSDELTGRFEYGADGDATIRHLYGEWNFGSGKLLVGQTDSLMKFSISNQVYNNNSGLKKYGKVDASRRPMIRLTFGGFQIAAISPNVDDLGATGTQVVMPKIEAKYKLSMDTFSLQAAAGYQTYEVDDKYDVDSYIIALGGKFNFGPAYVAGDAWFGQNVGPYGLACAPDDDPAIVGGELKDNDAYGLVGVLGFQVNDMVALEAGIGYVNTELDDAADEDEAMAYYIQATFTLASGVTIVPEIGFLDAMDDMNGADEGDELYYGMKFQINF